MCFLPHKPFVDLKYFKKNQHFLKKYSKSSIVSIHVYLLPVFFVLLVYCSILWLHVDQWNYVKTIDRTVYCVRSCMCVRVHVHEIIKTNPLIEKQLRHTARGQKLHREPLIMQITT